MRLLFLSQRVPQPPNKGDKIRSHHLARRLARRHEVHLAFLLDEPAETGHAEQAAKWSASAHWHVRSAGESVRRGALSLARGGAISGGWFVNGALERDVRSLLAAQPFDAVVAYCSSMVPYAVGFDGPRLVDFVDVDSEKWRQYAGRSGFPKRAVYALEHRRLRAWEARIVRDFERTVVISASERDLLGTFADGSRVGVVGNGVDAEAFAPEGPRCREPVLVFVGALDYFANADGVVSFVREAWPRVRARVPDAIFRIVGRRPGRDVTDLAEVDGVEVVPDPPDVRPWIRSAAVAVVPLRIAQGTQNKVLEAMAAGVPVVTTEAAVRGIEGEEGVHFRRAEHPDEWADAVADLLARPEEADALADRARRLVEERYSWDRRAESYEQEILCAVEVRGRRKRGAS